MLFLSNCIFRVSVLYRGINPLDAACREHDIAYSRSNDLAERHVADNIHNIHENAKTYYRETFDSWRENCCSNRLGEGQTKIGMDLKTKKKKVKRILPVAKVSYAMISYQSFRCWGFSVHWPVERRESRKW